MVAGRIEDLDATGGEGPDGVVIGVEPIPDGEGAEFDFRAGRPDEGQGNQENG
jgi:hypothetical protein